MKKYFIIVDMQKDFTTGSLANPAAQAIIPGIVAKAKELKEQGWTILATRDTHHSDYMTSQEGKNLPVVHCIEDTDGWEVVDEIRPLVDRYIDKPNFGYEMWNDELSIKTEEIALCGTVTEICVLANAIILKTEFPEVSISVYKDLCAGLNHHNEAIKCMESQQIKVI